MNIVIKIIMGRTKVSDKKSLSFPIWDLKYENKND